MTQPSPAALDTSSTPRRHTAPLLPFVALDTLWLQVTGTVCNIACKHCFITCGPKNLSHPMMTLEHVRTLLAGARELGVREYYFTGGEPFLHPEIFTLIEETLAQGPLHILTNGILIDDDVAARLGALFEAGPYTLDLRVSLDGASAAENDPIRGKGTFEQILAGGTRLMRHGINPVWTVTTVLASTGGDDGFERFKAMLAERGFTRPRLKFIPPFKIGREIRRAGGYGDDDILQEGDLFEGEEHVLQCGSCRMVTAKGVYPCPILIEEPGARMGETLAEGLVPIRLDHPACTTCHVEGFSCRT